MERGLQVKKRESAWLCKYGWLFQILKRLIDDRQVLNADNIGVGLAVTSLKFTTRPSTILIAG